MLNTGRGKNDMEVPKDYHELQRGELYQKGLRQFKEGTVPKLDSLKIYWVKKFVSVKDYNQHYKYDSSYCFLQKVPLKGVWIGFLLANHIPTDCSELDMEELRQVDDYRRAYSISPTPFKIVEIIKKDNEIKSNKELPLP